MTTADEKLQALIGATRAIHLEKSFAASARAIFDYCRDVTGATSGYVALMTDDGCENEVLFLEAGGASCSVNPELPMPIRGLREESYKTGKPVYHNDFMGSRWVGNMPAGHMALNNVMFAPLVIDRKTVGVIGIANKPADFTDDDAGVAAVLGELAAIALQNSRQMELLREKTASLERALTQVKTLRGLLPICSGCNKIRNDKGFWTKVEAYISEHTDAEFTHGMCPDCHDEYYPEAAGRESK